MEVLRGVQRKCKGVEVGGGGVELRGCIKKVCWEHWLRGFIERMG